MNLSITALPLAAGAGALGVLSPCVWPLVPVVMSSAASGGPNGPRLPAAGLSPAGAAFAGVFLGLTVGSIAFANRFIESELYVVLFFSIVVGGWGLKFVAFIVAAVLLRDQPWLEPKILFFSLLAGVIASLAIDAFVMLKSRLPYVSDPSDAS